MESIKITSVDFDGLSGYELEIVMKHLVDIRSRSTTIFQNADEPRTRTFLKGRREGIAKVYDSKGFAGIVMYDVVDTWYSNEPNVVEMLVLCVRKDVAGFGRVALGILETAADFYGASRIFSGNAINEHPSVDNLYRKDGYKKYSTYYKEVQLDNG